MNDYYYEYQIKSLKRKLECINREAWKYESLNKYKHPFTKLYSQLFSGKRTLGNRKYLKTDVNVELMEKRESYDD